MEKVSQIRRDGTLVLDYDSIYTPTEILRVLQGIFGPSLQKDRKQYVFDNKVALLVKNISFLGHSWTSDKKRMQLPDYYPEYVLRNTQNGLKSVYLGIYHYGSVQLFVVYDPNQFIRKKSHNSSAHVNIFDLQLAQRTGYFGKRDRFGNDVRIYKKDGFRDYVLRLAANENAKLLQDLNKYLADFATDIWNFIPKEWKAIDSIKEMKEAGDNNYRQMAWEGFYFEFLVKKFLRQYPGLQVEWHNDKKKEGIDLDLVVSADQSIYIDLKAHTEGDAILGNAMDTFEKVVEEKGGQIYYLCLDLQPESDSSHDYAAYKYWNSLRDPSKQEEVDPNKRQLKYSVEVKGIRLLQISKVGFELLKQKPFNQGHNSDGKPRKPKVSIAKKMVDDFTIYYKELKGKK